MNKEKLHEVLEAYKKDFDPYIWEKQYENEQFKWIAVKTFQDNWDIEANDFSEMLRKSLKDTGWILDTVNHFPRAMIIEFAEFDAERVREMFRSLFYDGTDMVDRIFAFKSAAEQLLIDCGKEGKNHYQDEHAITTYLWLQNPNEYYIYRYGEAKILSEILSGGYQFKAGYYEDNLRNYQKLYDEVCAVVLEDEELNRTLDEHLSVLFADSQKDNLVLDSKRHTLTFDISFYIKNYYSEGKTVTDKYSPTPTPDLNEEQNPEPIPDSQPKAEKYTKSDFLNQVYMSEDNYNDLVELLKEKKNIILQGAPGVGKTFAAERLAYSMMGEKDDSRIQFVQFHQNYSYEDFVLGYKPSGDGFELKDGIFYRFCEKARESGEAHFFIIDEINRGNMSKIFGELLMMIEKDYRNKDVTLAYGDRKLCVPENLYIIGMMNTADRSIAMIDYALRRRFSFFDMEPAFESDGFKKYRKKLNNERFDNLIEQIEALNEAIAGDISLGKGFRIGHSYFCGWDEQEGGCTLQKMRMVVEYDIIPMLEEYWFDDSVSLNTWKENLRGTLK